jgi:hypothetical protein
MSPRRGLNIALSYTRGFTPGYQYIVPVGHMRLLMELELIIALLGLLSPVGT